MSPSNHTTKTNVRRLLMAGFEALEVVNVGLFLVNESSQPLLANRTAEQIIAFHDGLELDGNGSLCTGKNRSPLFPAHSIREPQVPPQTRDLVFAVERPSGKRPLTVLIRPVRNNSSNAGKSTPIAFVFILDPEFSSHAAETGLRQLYGLTAAETRLACFLMEGNNVNDCCRHLGVRRTTVRMHLRNLFVKTGVQRQSELVSLLFKSIGLVRALEFDGQCKEEAAGNWNIGPELSLSSTRVLEELVTSMKLA
jgi:DNA-binding CsgD family transcriptional regulator